MNCVTLFSGLPDLCLFTRKIATNNNNSEHALNTLQFRDFRQQKTVFESFSNSRVIKMDNQGHKNDIEDLDAFLREDATSTMRKIELGEAGLIPQPVSKLPRTTDPVARLDNRITHISRSIEAVQENRTLFSDSLNNDAELSADLETDIDAWENLVTDLEETLTDIPDGISFSDTDDNNEILNDSVAAHIDTFVQEAIASASDQDAEVAMQDVFTADESFDLPDPDESGVKGNYMSDTETSGDSAEKDELQRSLEEREARINELEAELESMKVTLPVIAHEDAEAPEQPGDNLYVNRLLVVTSNDKTLKYPLTQHIMTVGREPHNDIHIRSKYISRYHARIVCDEDGTMVEDLDSRNGIAVNSRRVRRKLLKSGDLVDIGRVQFKYIDLMEGSADEGRA